MIATVLLCAAVFAQDESVLEMKDLGGTVTLPEGWRVPRWSDWDLDAIDNRETVQVHLEYTEFQVSPDKDSAKAWVGLAADRLRDQDHERVEMVRTDIIERDGQPVAEIEIKYRYGGKLDAVYYQRSFAAEGKTIHLSATAVNANAAKAKAALETWEKALRIDKTAADLTPLEGAVESKAGFGSTLPPGWRKPLPGERALLEARLEEGGLPKNDPEKCWFGMRPYPDGSAAMMLACKHYLYTGLLDVHSFAETEALVRTSLFKDAPIQPAAQVTASDDNRLAFYYQLPDAGQSAARIAAVPYNDGYILVYTLGPAGDAASIDTAVKATLVSTTFADGAGKHPVGALQYLDYLWKYRRTSPMVLGPAAVLLALLLAIGAKLLRPAPVVRVDEP